MKGLYRIVGLLLTAIMLAGGLPGGTLAAAPAQPPAPPPPETQPTASEPRSEAAPAAANPAVASAFDSSLSLDGSGDYVEVAHDPALNPTGAFTFEAWVRRSSGSRCETIISKGFMTAYWLGFCSGAIRFYASGSGSSEDGNTAIPADVWTHIAVVYQGSGRKYYINGELDYTGGPELAPTTNALPVYIGADPGGGTLYEFQGNIAEVRIWSVARTQDEIRRTMHVALEEPLPGLVANWHLSDDYQDNIGGYDGAGRGNASLSGPQAPPQPVFAPVDENFNTLPAGRYGAATAYIPGLDQALLIGGVRAGSRSAQIDAVDGATGDTTSLGALPAARDYVAATYAPDQDLVYVFGGRDSTPTPQNTIYRINPNTGVADTLAATLPLPLYGASAVYHDQLDKLYIIGGRGNAGVLNTITMFDPALETTTPLSLTLPAPRYFAPAAYSSVANRIYVFGGLNEVGSSTNTIYAIEIGDDGVTGAVTELAVTLPVASDGQTAVVDPLTQLIYLIGGSNQDYILAFDPVPDPPQLWQTPIKLPARRFDASVAYSPLNRHALLLGGYSTYNNVWRIPLGDGPAVPLGRWDFPTPVSPSVRAIDGDEEKVVVGTGGDGAWRYNADGTRYHYTKAMLGSSNGKVNDVRYHTDSDTVWLATDDAGGKVDNGTTLTTYDSSVLGTNKILSVDLASVNHPLFGTSGNGLAWRVYSPFPPPGFYGWTSNFGSNNVTALDHRAFGDLWAIVGGTLRRLTYNAFGSATETNYGSACGLYEPTDLIVAPNGDWWVVSPNFLFQTQETGAPTAESGVPGQGVCRIAAATTPGAGNLLEPLIGLAANSVDADADGRVWVAVQSQGNESGGLVAYQVIGGSASELRTGEWNWLSGPLGDDSLVPFSSSNLWDSGLSAIGAADERVWMGKPDGRLITLAQRWQQLDESNDLDSKIIQDVWTVRGRAFLGTSNSLHVLQPDGRTWDNLAGVKVWDVLGDSQGRTWVATNTGIRLYEPGGWDYLAWAEGARPATAIYALAEDQDGRIWIGGLHGLTLFDRERFVVTLDSTNSGLPADKVQTLLVDSDNRLWAGTNSGLARLDDDGWTVFTTADGLPSNDIYDLAQLPGDQIAISTASGLSTYDGSTFTAESPPIAPNNLPLSVDELGRLWAGSAVRQAAGWQGYYWTNSGLRSSEISGNAADQAGRVWFSHAPDTGVSVRGAYLPPLGDVIPTISSISPGRGSAGDEITINGSGFGSVPSDVQVSIGGAAPEIVSVSPTAIVVRLTDFSVSGDVSVTVGGRRTTLTAAKAATGDPPFCAEPVVTSITPTGGNDGVFIDIRGTNLDRAVQVTLGGGPNRFPVHRDPTWLQLMIQPGDANGTLQVINRCGDTADAPQEFRRIDLDLDTLVLNQGILSEGLVAGRPTMVSHFLTHDAGRRSSDALEVDTIELTFTEGSTVRTYTQRLDDGIDGVPPVPPNPRPLSAARLRDTANSVNVNVTPNVDGSLLPDNTVQVDVMLRRHGQLVAQGSTDVWFRPDFTVRVLLVPIMADGYTDADLRNLRNQVNADLDEARRRLMPTGRLEFAWSFNVIRRGANSVDLGDALQLYDTSHALDRARRWYNEHSSQDAMLAFGVVDTAAWQGSGNTGKAFWPDMSELLNVLLLDWVDTLCDIGNTALRIVTFGLAGSGDGCHLEIPLYVGWAVGRATNVSSLFGHEFGHVFGLVKPWAANGSLTDNVSHSVNDELDGGACGGGSATFNFNKSLYRQPNVRDPVVNPITALQLRQQNDGNANTARGKAIMSYACSRGNANVFFEPVDLIEIFVQFAVSSGLSFFHDLRPGSGHKQMALRATKGAPDQITPRPQAGERIYVSGTINRVSDTGTLRRVELLGEDAPLDASYATGYWLVQLDGGSSELARTGIAPVFATEGDLSADTGFFAATLLKQSGLARIELRHGDTALDTFTAGAAVPVVNITSPSGGTYSSGTIPVTWTATDSDGDDLEITILYSADNGTIWTPVEFSTGSGTVNIPVAQLAGSSNARMQVVASDGFNSGSATSAAFTVADQPPFPYIGHPADGATLLEGRPVHLSGGADDNQDGSVADGNLAWRSDRDGDLGTGAELDVLLSVGSHVLTLEAQNSRGLTTTAMVTVTVEGDYDYDTISDADELAEGLDPLSERDAYSDADGDGLPLVMERAWGLNPDNPDSDGDGRQDGDEIAAGSDPQVSDAPPAPNALQVSPGSLTFDADLSLDISMPQQSLQIVSRDTATWTVSADVAWLASSAISGTTPAGVTIMVDAYLLSDGTHNGTLTFANAALGSTVNVPVTVNVSNSVAHFDVSGDGQVTIVDVQQVAGWVFSNNSQPGFDHRYDVDRDGDVDVSDVVLIAQRWSPFVQKALTRSQELNWLVTTITSKTTR